SAAQLRNNKSKRSRRQRRTALVGERVIRNSNKISQQLFRKKSNFFELNFRPKKTGVFRLKEPHIS
ncbi:hypothetical protein, partial [Hoeflea sp. TYP-13]|uniref:hypothetical protein n=1 Tax=Hoeflea sp. TYP-13 TaxID=3230023 RepID=UPI0034C5CD67